jgi:hypothetical protein
MVYEVGLPQSVRSGPLNKWADLGGDGLQGSFIVEFPELLEDRMKTAETMNAGDF